MTTKDWEDLGTLIGLFVLAIVAIWVLTHEDYFDGDDW